MLSLSRKLGETIVIGDIVEIMILPGDRNCTSVRLGITAPLDVSVYRSEIYERIKGKKIKNRFPTRRYRGGDKSQQDKTFVLD